MTASTSERMGRVQAFRERMKFPAALCRTCGALVQRGDGVRDDEGLSSVTSTNAAVIDTIRAKNHLPALDGWRRAHEACDGLDYAEVLARITGLDVTHEVASAVLGATRLSVLAWRESPIRRDGAAPDIRGERPYSWLDEHAHAELRHLVTEARSRLVPSYCASGACAFCGVGEAMGWTESPLEWRDGTPAPLCGPCNQIFEMRGDPTDEHDVRVVALEAFTGYAELCGPTMGMRAFYELATDDERTVGYMEPWAYRPEALAEVRRQAWESRPELAPADEAQRIITRQTEELRASRERASELAITEGAGISWAAPAHDVG